MKFKTGKLPQDDKERLKYLYKFQEMLRLFHNQKGQEFEDGKITEREFRSFQNGWFDKRNLLICQEINKCTNKIPEFIADKKIPPLEKTDIRKEYREARKDISIIIDITDIEDD